MLEEKGEGGVRRGYAYGQVPLDRHVLLVGKNSAGKTSLAKLATVLLGLGEREKRRLVSGSSFHQFYLRGNGVVGIAFSSPKRDLTVVVAHRKGRYQIYAVSDLLDVDFFLRREEGRVLSLEEWVEKLRLLYGEPVPYTPGNRLAFAPKLVYVQGWESYLDFLKEPSLTLGVGKRFLPQYAALLAELFAEGEEGDILKTLQSLLLNSLEGELDDLEKNEADFRASLDTERSRHSSAGKAPGDWKGVVRWTRRWREILKELLPLEEGLEGDLHGLSGLQRSAEEALPQVERKRRGLFEEVKDLEERKRLLARERERLEEGYAQRESALREERGKALGALNLLKEREERARKAWEALSLSPEELEKLPLLESLLRERREGLKRERSARLASLEEELKELRERRRALWERLEERKRSERRAIEERIEREMEAELSSWQRRAGFLEKRLRFLRKLRDSLREMPSSGAENPRNPFSSLRLLEERIQEGKRAIEALRERERELRNELAAKAREVEELARNLRALEKEERGWLDRKEELLSPESLYRALESSPFPWRERLGAVLSPALLGEKGLYASWEEYREDWGLFGLQLRLEALPPFEDPLEEVGKALKEIEGRKEEGRRELERKEGEAGSLRAELEEVSRRIEELSEALRESEEERLSRLESLEARRKRALRWVEGALRRAEEAAGEARSRLADLPRKWDRERSSLLKEVEGLTDPELEGVEREIARLASLMEALRSSEGLEEAYQEVQDLEERVARLRRGWELRQAWEREARALSESGEVWAQRARSADEELALLLQEREERRRAFHEAGEEVERRLGEAREALGKAEDLLKALQGALERFGDLREELAHPQVPPFLREGFGEGRGPRLFPEDFPQAWDSWGREALERTRRRLRLLANLRAQLASMSSVGDVPSVAHKERGRVIAQDLEARVKSFYTHLWRMRAQLENALGPIEHLRETVRRKGEQIQREVLKGRFSQAEWASFEVRLDLDSLPWYERGLRLVRELRALEDRLALVDTSLFGGFGGAGEGVEEVALRLYEELLSLADRSSFVEDLRRSLTVRGVARKLDVTGGRRELVPIERQRDLKAHFSRGTAYLLRASLVAGFLRGLLGSWDGLGLPLVLDEVSVVDPKGLRRLLGLLEELGFHLLGTTPHTETLLSEGVEAVFIDRFMAVPATHPARKEDLRARLSESVESPFGKGEPVLPPRGL